MLYLLSYSCFNVEKWRKKEKIQFKYLIDLSDNKLEVLVVGCDHFLTKKKKTIQIKTENSGQKEETQRQENRTTTDRKTFSSYDVVLEKFRVLQSDFR